MHQLRYEYCSGLYSREFDIKERLEKKAAFVFALPSSLVGALFLKDEPANMLLALFSSATTAGSFAVFILSFVVFMAGIVAAIAFAVASLLVQRYDKENPEQLHTFLFAPASAHLHSKNALYDELSARLAIAVEHNAAANALKASRLRYATIALLVAVIALLFFISASLSAGGPL